MQACNYTRAPTCQACQTCGLGKPPSMIKPANTPGYPPACMVPGCTTTGKRGTQCVCDACRRRFIKSKSFRARLSRLGIVPD